MTAWQDSDWHMAMGICKGSSIDEPEADDITWDEQLYQIVRPYLATNVASGKVPFKPIQAIATGN